MSVCVCVWERERERERQRETKIRLSLRTKKLLNTYRVSKGLCIRWWFRMAMHLGTKATTTSNKERFKLGSSQHNEYRELKGAGLLRKRSKWGQQPQEILGRCGRRVGSWVIVSHVYGLPEKGSGWAKGQVRDGTKFLQGLARADDAEKSDGDVLERRVGLHGGRALGTS